MKNRVWTICLAAVGSLILILDSKTALYGASEGMELCLRTVIPTMLPFFVLSLLLTGSLAGTSIPLLRPLGKLCAIPKGGEVLFLVGILGGYPTGAQAVAHAYESGQLSRNAARRLLGFCSNAGPAFLFGMVATRFCRMRYAWILWAIHILGAVITGILLPGRQAGAISSRPSPVLTMQQALKKSVRILSEVCGWIVLCRVVVAFCERWFLWLFPKWAQLLFTGLIELANGCSLLGTIPDEGLRFVLASAMLSLGGFCVLLQTKSVVKSLGLGMYFPGKLMQTAVCVTLSVLYWLFFR